MSKDAWQTALTPQTMIDPPAGWKFGFPRRFDAMPGESFEDWLLRCGYPADHLPLARMATRYWIASE